MDHDDLTSSRWDDVVSPGTQSTYAGFSSAFGSSQLTTGFGALNVDDDHADSEPDQEEAQPAEHLASEDSPNAEPSEYANITFGGSAVDTARSQLEQLQELKREERNQHKSQLLNDLAQSDDFDTRLEKTFASPSVSSSGALFNDQDGPIKANYTSNTHNQGPPTKPKNTKLFRPRKYASKQNIKHLNCKAAPADLGPLGFQDNKSSDSIAVKSNTKEDLLREAERPLYEIPKDAKQLPVPEAISKSVPPLPEENANDKNELDISVNDPMKVGDITNAHIVYSITTRNKNLNQGNFPKREEPFTVTRRYKDFRWIYHQLQDNHLGKIIPPPPSKQTYIGRFNESFIENRRFSLEKMLNKISNNPVLSTDPDFVLFLTSDDFANESKERERVSGSGASMQNNDALDSESSSEVVDNEVAGQSGNGFMSNFFSIGPKFVEPDAYFTEKRSYIEGLESNLNNLHKSIDLIITQRLDLTSLIDEMTVTIDELASLDISKQTTELLLAFNEVETKIKENLDRVNLQDHLTLGFTIEEYLRIIGSIKFILDKRMKIFQQFQNLSQDLTKKRGQLNKLSNRNPEKLAQLNFEVDKLTQRTTGVEKRFNTISDTIKRELEIFEIGKIDEFRNSVEIFIESSIESQKESIELWETFYERQGLSKF